MRTSLFAIKPYPSQEDLLAEKTKHAPDGSSFASEWIIIPNLRLRRLEMNFYKLV